MKDRPSELAISLAAIQAAWRRALPDGGWTSADEIRGQLKMFGFDATTQQVAGWLGRMARVDAPWVETRPPRWDGAVTEYRVTRYGKTDIGNKLPVLRVDTPWLDALRRAA